KPLAVIVSPQHSQKLEEFRREVRPAGNRAQLHQYSLIDFVLLSSTIPDKFYGLARRQGVHADLRPERRIMAPDKPPIHRYDSSQPCAEEPPPARVPVLPSAR